MFFNCVKWKYIYWNYELAQFAMCLKYILAIFSHFLCLKAIYYYKFSSIFIYTWHWLLCLFCRRIWLYMTLKRVNSVSLGQNSCRSLIFALLSALKQNMQLLQSSGIDVQFVNILYLSSPECVRQSALLLDIEGDKQK